MNKFSTCRRPYSTFRKHTSTDRRLYIIAMVFVSTVLLLILNQTNFRLAYNQIENCRNDHSCDSFSDGSTFDYEPNGSSFGL